MTKLEDIIKDTKFLEKISSASTDEEIQNILSTKNIDISLEQLKEAKKVAEELKNKNGKIDDESLENIAGGKWYDGVYALSKSAAVLSVGAAVLYGVYKVTNNLDQLTDSASDTMNRAGHLISTTDEQIPGLAKGASDLMGATTGLVSHADGSMDPLLGALPMGIGKDYKKNKK